MHAGRGSARRDVPWLHDMSLAGGRHSDEHRDPPAACRHAHPPHDHGLQLPLPNLRERQALSQLRGWVCRMSDLTFVRFVETNEHEAETWAWWLQLDGNKAQLDRLGRLLREAAPTSPYFDDFAWSLYLDDVEPEPIVDKLVQYADLGYYAAHNKVTGVFSCPDELGKGFGNLYKGRIRDYFTPPLADADAVRLVPVDSTAQAELERLRDELEQADRFGRREFRVTTWPYDRVVKALDRVRDERDQALGQILVLQGQAGDMAEEIERLRETIEELLDEREAFGVTGDG